MSVLSLAPVCAASLRLSRVISAPLMCGLSLMSLNQAMTMFPWPLPPSLMRSSSRSWFGMCVGLASSVMSLSTHDGWRQPEW